MKHLIIIAITFCVTIASAQKNVQEKLASLTSEQIAELKTKQLALSLDLNKQQQQQIYNLTLIKVKELKQKPKLSPEERKAKLKDLSPEELYKIKNQRLDKAIAHKKQMKSILNEAQYKKWDKLHTMKKARIIKKRRDSLSKKRK